MYSLIIYETLNGYYETVCDGLFFIVLNEYAIKFDLNLNLYLYSHFFRATRVKSVNKNTVLQQQSLLHSVFVPVISEVSSLLLNACLAEFLIRHSARACFISVCLILRPLGSISASADSQCHSIWSGQLCYIAKLNYPKEMQHLFNWSSVKINKNKK